MVAERHRWGTAAVDRSLQGGGAREMRLGFVALAAVLVLGSLVALALLLDRAQDDAHEAVEQRFSERAQISAALTQSVFSALGGISVDELQSRYGGPPHELAVRLRRQLPESRSPYLAVVDAGGRTLAAAGRPPRRLALARAAPRAPVLSNVVRVGKARVVEYAIPFGRRHDRRTLVQGVPLALMTSFLDGYLRRLHEVDGAGLAVSDGRGVMLTRTGSVSASGVPKPERLATSAAVPGTPWTLRLEAPRARVLAGVDHLRWLPWLLLAALSLAAVTAVWLLRRMLASARRQREANVALHESREQIRNLVDALEEGVILHHADGRTELLNASARELMDGEGEVSSLPPDWELLDEAGALLDESDTAVKRALASGAACTQLMALKRPDGTRRWLKVRARPLVRPGEERPYAAVASSSDVTEQRETELHLTDLAQREPLTGLWNRRRFEEDLARQIARCRRHGERAALVLIDIDNFKGVNDTLGHLAGDEVLRALADGLRKCPGGDTAARIGGDEFAVVLRDVGAAEAGTTARQLATRLTAIVRDELHGHGELSLSVGIAVLDGQTREVAEAFATADLAMYADKRRAGRPADDRVGLPRSGEAVLGREEAAARRPGTQPYRQALSHELAVEEIARESGRQFCPAAAGALIEVLRDQEAHAGFAAAAGRAPQVAGSV